jgi:hypothetical protein
MAVKEAEAADEPPAEGLRWLIKTDADPRARQRAQAVLPDVAGGTRTPPGERRASAGDEAGPLPRRATASARRDGMRLVAAAPQSLRSRTLRQ